MPVFVGHLGRLPSQTGRRSNRALHLLPTCLREAQTQLERIPGTQCLLQLVEHEMQPSRTEHHGIPCWDNKPLELLHPHPTRGIPHRFVELNPPCLWRSCLQQCIGSRSPIVDDPVRRARNCFPRRTRPEAVQRHRSLCPKARYPSAQEHCTIPPHQRSCRSCSTSRTTSAIGASVPE